jgi:RimJ/RimL family protein N-acetyltransferase
MRLRKASRAVLKPLKGAVIPGQKVRLREKKLSDVRNDYRWQSDPELARLDAATLLTLPFSVFLLEYTTALRRYSNRRYPLAVDTADGRHIGNCTCYDIDDKQGEAQLGIMIGERDYWDKGYGTDVINTLADHVFGTTELRRLYLKTLDWNARAQRCFAKCGFTPCGKMAQDNNCFVLMELTRERWEKQKEAS